MDLVAGKLALQHRDALLFVKAALDLPKPKPKTVKAREASDVISERSRSPPRHGHFVQSGVAEGIGGQGLSADHGSSGFDRSGRSRSVTRDIEADGYNGEAADVLMQEQGRRSGGTEMDRALFAADLGL